MSAKLVEAARKESAARGATFAVLAYLAGCVEDDGPALAWPSRSTIARDTRWDDRTVARALKRLVELGEIEDTGERRGELHERTVVWAIRPGRTP